MKSLFILLALVGLTFADIYDNCGPNGQNCFAIPEFESDLPTCLAQKDCKVIVSFNREANNGVKFELQAQYKGADDGHSWVGVGLSDDKEMGQDSVVACYGSTVANYWNRVDPLYSLPLADSMVGLSDAKSSVGNGKIECSFVRAAKTTLNLPADLGTAEIDLDAKPYFVLLATGPLDDSDEFIGPHQDAEHTKQAVQL